MESEGIMLSEINQREKEKYCMILLRCGILNKQITKQTKIPKLREKEIRVMLPELEGGRKGNWRKVAQRWYKLPVVR